MESTSVNNKPVTVSVSKTSSDATVTNVRVDTGTSPRVMVARAAIVTQLEVTTHPATPTPVNASVNPV